MSTLEAEPEQQGGATYRAAMDGNPLGPFSWPSGFKAHPADRTLGLVDFRSRLQARHTGGAYSTAHHLFVSCSG